MGKSIAWKLGFWKLDLRLPKLWPSTSHRSKQDDFLKELVLEARAAGRTRSEIVDRVAGEIYSVALVDEGWLLDLGVWGPSIYLPEARAVVDEVLGQEQEETPVESSRLEA